MSGKVVVIQIPHQLGPRLAQNGFLLQRPFHTSATFTNITAPSASSSSSFSASDYSGKSVVFNFRYATSNDSIFR